MSNDSTNTSTNAPQYAPSDSEAAVPAPRETHDNHTEEQRALFVEYMNMLYPG